jgi:RNA polymerase sigma factor (sigma-70 family)
MAVEFTAHSRTCPALHRPFSEMTGECQTFALKKFPASKRLRSPSSPAADKNFVRFSCLLRSGGMNAQCKTLKLGAESPLPATALTPVIGLDYDQAVKQFYKPLYQFAFGLTGCESDAADLTQETYRVLLIKGGQVRDGQKLKSWLFTTLYRKFLGQRRHATRFPKVEVEMVEGELPVINAQQVENTEANVVLAALQALEEKYRAPLAMFYLEEMSYREISDVLGVPPGTVMSRLSRSKEQLKQRLAACRHLAPSGEAEPRRQAGKQNIPTTWTDSKWEKPLTKNAMKPA